jgi:hypothetical protein
MLGVTVELVLVVHDHVEVTFEEGGRARWIDCIDFTRSLARPAAAIIVIFSLEVVSASWYQLHGYSRRA